MLIPPDLRKRNAPLQNKQMDAFFLFGFAFCFFDFLLYFGNFVT
ncbi:hypothetical protein LmNIHS28_00889 [Listeria monocytogenes]|nr:hypothetical protein F2382_02251 [Listeria monocytogenes]GAM94957.1 hypothetical protein LmNIHS28_00889 [Listeria monocytogenes]